jgi:DnaJ-class molecular chaperone
MFFGSDGGADENDGFQNLNGFSFPNNGIGGHHMGGHHHHTHKKRTQDPPIEHELLVSLEEIASGATKKMKISRKVLNSDHHSTRIEDKVLTIDIKPGWKQGTKITFTREGDQSPSTIPADIIFIIKDKPHSVFRRDGSDLIYTARITLKDVSFIADKHAFFVST